MGTSHQEVEQLEAWFTQIASEQTISVNSALDVTCGKYASVSDMFVRALFNLTAVRLEKIRSATLFQYKYHRDKAYHASRTANAPANHFCMPLCIQWDETEQLIAVPICEESDCGLRPVCMWQQLAFSRLLL